MKKKEIRLFAIIIPIILCVILCIAFVLFFSNHTDMLFPAAQDTVFMYHDSDNVADKTIADDATPQTDDKLGTITIKNKQLDIRYNASYSNYANCVSVQKCSNKFGDIGCVYLSAYQQSVTPLVKQISVDSTYGKFDYTYQSQFTANSEYEVLQTSPNYSKSLIVYYPKTDGNSALTEYIVYVYKEVG